MSTTKWGSYVNDYNQVEHYFKEYVYGFMKTDIKREIELVRSGKSAGNFLCALGLLCYTEAMGFIIKGENSQNYERFNAFFEMMGQKYQQFLRKQPDKRYIYQIYRNKMAHVYFATDCDIFMLKDADISKYIHAKDLMGLGVLPNGKNYFCVEKYFLDFNRACKKLHNEIMCGKRPGGHFPST